VTSKSKLWPNSQRYFDCVVVFAFDILFKLSNNSTGSRSWAVESNFKDSKGTDKTVPNWKLGFHILEVDSNRGIFLHPTW